MDFFGIGPLELLLILIILIVVVGPEKVPDVARRLGRAMRAFRGATTQITREIDRELQGIKEDARVDINLDGNGKKPRKEPPGTGEKGQG